MVEHELLTQIAFLKVELAKKDKLLREKDEMLAEHKEQPNNLEQENALLQAENVSARKNKTVCKCISILICRDKEIRSKAPKGDEEELQGIKGDEVSNGDMQEL
eukprot:14585226-Ditylum_brightwellii.AAC.2